MASRNETNPGRELNMEALKLSVNEPDVVRRHIQKHVDEVQHCVNVLPHEDLAEIVALIVEACRESKQVFIFGNGGSASTASHFACDLGKGAVVENRPRLRVQSLNDNMAIMTAISNDISYEMVFAEQLKNLLNPGDVVIGISASGNSPNVLRAFEYAREIGGRTIGLIGFGGGKMAPLSDVKVVVDSYDYGVVEGLHMVLEHLISQSVREKLIHAYD